MSSLDIFRRNSPSLANRRGMGLGVPAMFNDPLFRRMDRLFQDLTDDLFNARPGLPANPDAQLMQVFQPATDIEETEKEYMVSIDVPGIRKEDISVELQGNVLHVSGERNFERKDDKSQNRYIERSYGRFERAFSLPENVDPEAVQAQFENGVLHLVLPKSETAQRRKISVGEGGGRALDTDVRRDSVTKDVEGGDARAQGAGQSGMRDTQGSKKSA